MYLLLDLYVVLVLPCDSFLIFALDAGLDGGHNYNLCLSLSIWLVFLWILNISESIIISLLDPGFTPFGP